MQEERWDNRFINDTLYDKSEPKRVLKRAGSNRKLKPRVGNEKKVYKTFVAVDSGEGKGKGMIIVILGQMRSFNIRTYSKKE